MKEPESFVGMLMFFALYFLFYPEVVTFVLRNVVPKNIVFYVITITWLTIKYITSGGLFLETVGVVSTIFERIGDWVENISHKNLNVDLILDEFIMVFFSCTLWIIVMHYRYPTMR